MPHLDHIQIGDRYEYLTVVEKLPKAEVRLLCDCGTVKDVSASHWRRHIYKSCGCQRNASIAKTLMIDLTNQRFGRLTAIRRLAEYSSNGYSWECICDCGKTVNVLVMNLRTGNSKSCGCLQRERTGNRFRTHGQANTKTYNTHIQRKRQAAKKQRIPKWADLDAIREFYVNCPEGMTVDHIIPMQGKLVSGLHVLNNLQYLTPSENARKRIKFEPLYEVRT